jgi:hypothetical protein
MVQLMGELRWLQAQLEYCCQRRELMLLRR